MYIIFNIYKICVLLAFTLTANSCSKNKVASPETLVRVEQDIY